MKRSWLSMVLIAVTLLSLALPQRAAFAEESSLAGEITGQNVAFRSEARGSSSIIRRLDKGTVVEVLRTNVNAEWHQVRLNGKTGYVNRLYVRVTKQSASDGLVGTVVNCNVEVNVRKTPSTSGQIAGAAKRGSTYTVTKLNAELGWHEVSYNGAAAYISAKYLSVVRKATNKQLSSLTVEGGTLSPAFAPDEYGYVVVATSDKVKITVDANSGVRVAIDGSGKRTATYTVREGTSHTVRISIGGQKRYAIYIVRGALIVGSWNIKRGNDRLLDQGNILAGQSADLVGVQEVYQSKKTPAISDNLLSLRTKELQYARFVPTLDYAGGAQYGIGILSRLKPTSSEHFSLPSADKEPRALQKIVVTYNGKKVSFYNTHFSFDSSSLRAKQFAEVLKIMGQDKNEYKILVGDFNASASEFSRMTGYKVLNTTSTKFYGYDGSTLKKNEIDNILVTKNITVLNVRMVETSSSDHKPLFAFLRLD